ncbi:putative AAA-ATPase domain-containing protein [Ditylenchus destructor]|uniref:AAA-ATPase domain-containing protein n=1 Tax=Ditylenchus destructor TaxID=166010 RepID=A0AAD4QY68_9BILA|nr:putative AAA-ATPase domain-containing protein [Ditylenchus destructor]
MRVFVRVPNHGTFQYDVTETEDTKQLKDMVVKQLGIAQNDTRLIYGGKQLDDSKQLRDYEIRDRCTVDLLGSLLGGMKFNLQTSSESKQMEVETEKETLADDIGEIFPESSTEIAGALRASFSCFLSVCFKFVVLAKHNVHISTMPSPPQQQQQQLSPPSSATTFKQLLQCSGFIDKTQFIDEFIKCPENEILITAPSGMGKSLLLKMLRDFFSDSKEDLEIDQPDRSKLFDNLWIKGQQTFEQMGSLPVIFVEFPTMLVRNRAAAINSLSSVLRVAIRQHYDVIEDLEGSSPKFNKRAVTQSLNRLLNDKQLFEDVRDAIKNLSMAIDALTGKKPLLIFDNYDSLCSILECEQPTRSTTEEARSGQTTKKRKLNDDATESKAFGPVEYNELLNGILTASIAKNDCYHKVLLAGHYTISLNPNLTKSITNYDFVNDIKPLTSQIGFNEADFEASCKHYKIDESDRKRIREHFVGKRINGDTFYNPSALLRYLWDKDKVKYSEDVQKGIVSYDWARDYRSSLQGCFDALFCNRELRIVLHNISGTSGHAFSDMEIKKEELKYLSEDHECLMKLPPNILMVENPQKIAFLKWMVSSGYAYAEEIESGELRFALANKKVSGYLLKKARPTCDSATVLNNQLLEGATEALREFTEQSLDNIKTEQLKNALENLLQAFSKVTDFRSGSSNSGIHGSEDAFHSIVFFVVANTPCIKRCGSEVVLVDIEYMKDQSPQSQRVTHHISPEPERSGTSLSVRKETKVRADIVFTTQGDRGFVIEMKYNEQGTDGGMDQIEDRYYNGVWTRYRYIKEKVNVVINVRNNQKGKPVCDITASRYNSYELLLVC